PDDVAAGKELFVIYQGQGLARYQALKEDIKQLKESGKYEGVERTNIARRFGRLLGYSPRGINELLSVQTDFRTMFDFGIEASNTFLYYKDLAAATRFYQDVLGLELIADYGMATTFRISSESYLILVDAEAGMHSADEPKTVALALLTDQLEAWWNYLNEQNVPVKYSYKTKEGGPHDGFVMIDPEGYLLEFELFKQHPENEGFMPYLDQAEHFTTPIANSKVPEGLGFKASITWLYYTDMLEMQQFYEEVLGLEMVADQGWTKIYGVSNTGFIGLVDERRGMHDFTEEKAVTVSFFLKDLKGWYDYVKAKQPFELRTGEWETGPEKRYNAFVGYDPQGYFIEFDRFLDHPDNKKLLDALQAVYE
ncbi:MAG: VOC family protein, partial [Bacteroidota bacterium]